jgi:hypothetical protein
MKKYVDGVLILGIGVCLFTLMEQNKQINKMKFDIKPNSDSLILTMKNKIDSLNSEIFTKDIEIGRYEVIFDRAEGEMSPECKIELESIKHTVE